MKKKQFTVIYKFCHSEMLALLKAAAMKRNIRLDLIVSFKKYEDTVIAVQNLCIGTDRSQQTVQTKIRLLLKKQSD